MSLKKIIKLLISFIPTKENSKDTETTLETEKAIFKKMGLVEGVDFTDETFLEFGDNKGGED